MVCLQAVIRPVWYNTRGLGAGGYVVQGNLHSAKGSGEEGAALP